MAISNTSLTLGTSNVYVSTGNTVVSVMYFCNLGATAANLNVYAVPASQSVASGATQIYREVQIAAGDTYVVDMEKLVLTSGDQIKANTGGTVTATVSYVVI
jgi:hypothetical protein